MPLPLMLIALFALAFDLDDGHKSYLARIAGNG